MSMNNEKIDSVHTNKNNKRDINTYNTKITEKAGEVFSKLHVSLYMFLRRNKDKR